MLEELFDTMLEGTETTLDGLETTLDGFETTLDFDDEIETTGLDGTLTDGVSGYEVRSEAWRRLFTASTYNCSTSLQRW